MTGVTLRCPHCGTTQGVLGECEACREAEVRYFCTNHTPGLWLDAPSCSRCGARFGQAEPDRHEPEPTPSASEMPPPVRPRRMDADAGPWARAEDRPDLDSRGPTAPDPTRILLDMLSAAARSRPLMREYHDKPRRRGGCLRTLFMLALLLLGLFVLGPILLGMFMGYG